ncbi:mannose 6-phosphate receptor domain-containing protein [Xylariaceae sp. FL0662B]|nr:mannose 6-phosphate receptor domain-containing protein [Xylariaceae sp. FL0662B]
MRFSPTSRPAYSAISSLLSLTTIALAADADKTTTSTACTASSTSGAFFDLRPDIAIKPNPDGSNPPHSNGAPTVNYHARGYDYGSNFTLNVCGPVIGELDSVIGVEEGKWQNISAYYTSKGLTYSLGEQSGHLVTRGKELVLEYTGGSPCGKSNKRDALDLEDRSAVHDGASYRGSDYEREGDTPSATTTVQAVKETDEPKRRKSAIIFFSCDRDPAAGAAQVSFIAADPEECSYVFKVKSQHACASAEPHKPGSVGPGSVFAIILAIAVLVYLLGGIVYQRTVANARGWRQLPNYSLWANVWSFICVRRLLTYDRSIISSKIAR